MECIKLLNYIELENKNVLVVGLVKSGYEVVKFFFKLGVNVKVNDGKDFL